MNAPARALGTLAVVALSLGLAACGSDQHSADDHSNADGAARTVEIVMTDNAYAPTEIAVAAGERVRMRFRNDGTVDHEAVLGDEAVQARHHDEMLDDTEDMGHGAMDGDHSDDSVMVRPGETGEMTRTFDEAGQLIIGCHEPGHWEDGMRATVSVN